VHDDSLTTPASQFGSENEATGAAASPPPAEPAAAEVAPVPTEALDFSIEPPADQTFASVAEAAVAPDNVELPADLSGMYSIVDVPPFEAPPPVAAAPEPLSPKPETPALSDLPLIMPEDVTPPEELARPSARLVQMVSPTPPREEPAATAEPMLTETMGDLYLKQGFRSEAADVYRRLLSQRPGDEGLAAKLRAVEAPPPDLSAAALGAESVGTWLRRVALARLSAPAPTAPAPPESANGPSPLEAAFSAPAPISEAIGEPTHPAPEAFSLDQIFGSAPDASPAPSAASGAPAAPSGASPTPPPTPGASFDEFFGQPPEAGSVRPAATAPDQPAQGGDEDVGAFNAWLQGLKK